MEVGDIVEIKNASLSGKEVIEGKAKLLKKLRVNFPTLGWDLWQVRFSRDKTVYERSIERCEK